MIQSDESNLVQSAPATRGRIEEPWPLHDWPQGDSPVIPDIDGHLYFSGHGITLGPVALDLSKTGCVCAVLCVLGSVMTSMYAGQMACELEICSMQAVLIQRLEEDDATWNCEQSVEDDMNKFYQFISYKTSS